MLKVTNQQVALLIVSHLAVYTWCESWAANSGEGRVQLCPLSNVCPYELRWGQPRIHAFGSLRASPGVCVNRSGETKQAMKWERRLWWWTAASLAERVGLSVRIDRIMVERLRISLRKSSFVLVFLFSLLTARLATAGVYLSLYVLLIHASLFPLRADVQLGQEICPQFFADSIFCRLNFSSIIVSLCNILAENWVSSGGTPYCVKIRVL